MLCSTSETKSLEKTSQESQIKPRTKIHENWSHQSSKFKKSEIVWAKISGYPWWPAVVISVPEQKDPYFNKDNRNGKFFSEATVKPKMAYRVDFVADQTHAFLKRNCLQSYHENKQKLTKEGLEYHLRKRRFFEIACEEAEQIYQALEASKEEISKEEKNQKLEDNDQQTQIKVDKQQLKTEQFDDDFLQSKEPFQQKAKHQFSIQEEPIVCRQQEVVNTSGPMEQEPIGIEEEQEEQLVKKKPAKKMKLEMRYLDHSVQMQEAQPSKIDIRRKNQNLKESQVSYILSKYKLDTIDQLSAAFKQTKSHDKKINKSEQKIADQRFKSKKQLIVKKVNTRHDLDHNKELIQHLIEEISKKGHHKQGQGVESKKSTVNNFFRRKTSQKLFQVFKKLFQTEEKNYQKLRQLCLCLTKSLFEEKPLIGGSHSKRKNSETNLGTHQTFSQILNKKLSKSTKLIHLVMKGKFSQILESEDFSHETIVILKSVYVLTKLNPREKEGEDKEQINVGKAFAVENEKTTFVTLECATMRQEEVDALR